MMEAWTVPGVAGQVGDRDSTPVSPHSIHSQDELWEDDKGSSLFVPETQAGFATQAPALSKQSSQTAYPFSVKSNSTSKGDPGAAKVSEETEPLVQDPKNAQLMSLLSQKNGSRKSMAPRVQSLGGSDQASFALNSTPVATIEEPLIRSALLQSPHITDSAALSGASSSNGEARIRLNLTPERAGSASRQAKSQPPVEQLENQSCVAPDTTTYKSDNQIYDVQPRSSTQKPTPDVAAEKSPKKTPINVIDPWEGMKRISRRRVRIPSNQRKMLEDDNMLWFPPEPGAREPNRHIPLEILNSLTKLVERRSKRAKGLHASSAQPSSSLKPVSTPFAQDTDCSAASGEDDEEGEMGQNDEESEGNDDDDDEEEEIEEDKEKAKADARGEERERIPSRKDVMEGEGRQEAAAEDDPDDDEDLPWSQSPSPKRGEQLPPDSSPAVLGHANSASLHKRMYLGSESSGLAASVPNIGPAPRGVPKTHSVEDGSYSAERKAQGRAGVAEPSRLTPTREDRPRSSLTVSDKKIHHAPAQEDALIDPEASLMEGVQGATLPKVKSDAESDLLGQQRPNESTSGSGPWTQPGQGAIENHASNPSLDLVTITTPNSDSEESELECAIPHAYDDQFVEASLSTDSSLVFEPTSAQRQKSPGRDRKHTRTLAPAPGSRHSPATRESTSPSPQYSLAQSGLNGDTRDATASSRPVSDLKDDLGAQTDGVQDSDEVNSQEFYGQMQAEMDFNPSPSRSPTKKYSTGSNLMTNQISSLDHSAESGVSTPSDQSLLRRSSEGHRITSGKRKEKWVSERIVPSKRVKLSDRSVSESIGSYAMEPQDTHQIAGQRKLYPAGDTKASSSLKFLPNEDMTDSTKNLSRKQPSSNIKHKALAGTIQDHTTNCQLQGATTAVSLLSRVDENNTGANTAGGFITRFPEQENDRAWESDKMSVEDETIFSLFTAVYPNYPGTLVAFVKTCAYIEWLLEKGKMVHRSLWDDFVIRYLTEFPAWSNQRLSSGLENLVPYERFYDDEIEEPLYTQRILSPVNLTEALSLDPKSAGVMRYDFIPRLKELKSSPVMQANGDYLGLIAVVNKKRASIGGTTANSRSRSSTPQRMLPLGGSNHPNHLMRRPSGPKDHIEEMKTTPTRSKVPKSSETAGRKDTTSHIGGSATDSSKEDTPPVTGHFFSTNDPPEATQARASNPDAARWNMKSSKGQRSPPGLSRPTQVPSETTPTARSKEEAANRVLSQSSDSLSIQSRDVLWPREATAYPATHAQTPKTTKFSQRIDGSSHVFLTSPILGRTPPTPSLPLPQTGSPSLSPVQSSSRTTTVDPSNHPSQASAQRQTSQTSSSVSVQESLPLPLPPFPVTGRITFENEASQFSAVQHTSTGTHRGGPSQTQTTFSRLPHPPTSPPRSPYAPRKEAAHGPKERKPPGPKPTAKSSKPVKQVKSAIAATTSTPRHEQTPTVSKFTSPASAKAQAISTPPSKGPISSEALSANRPNLKVRQWLSNSPPVVRPVVQSTTRHSIASESLPTTSQRPPPARSDPIASQATGHRSPIRSATPEVSQRRKRVKKNVESDPNEALSRQQGAEVRANRDAEPTQAQTQAQAPAHAPESTLPALPRSTRAPPVPDRVPTQGDPPSSTAPPDALQWWQEANTPFKSFVAAYGSLKSVRAEMGLRDAEAESKGGAGLLAKFLRGSVDGEAGAGEARIKGRAKVKGRVAWEEFCRSQGR